MKGINDTIIIQKLIGARLKAARQKKGLQRPQFVADLCSSQTAPMESGATMNVERLKQWEAGNNPVSLEWIPVICEVLKCDVGYLFGEYEEELRVTSDICKATGLSTTAINNLLTVKNISEIGKLFSWGGTICRSQIQEETPIGVISSLIGDETILRLLYLFFVTEDLDEPGVVKNTRSNAILIELIGELLNKRNYLAALRPEVEEEGGTGDG